MTIGIRVFMAKLKQLFHQQRANVELEDEIQVHIQMLKERFMNQGKQRRGANLGTRLC